MKRPTRVLSRQSLGHKKKLDAARRNELNERPQTAASPDGYLSGNLDYARGIGEVFCAIIKFVYGERFLVQWRDFAQAGNGKNRARTVACIITAEATRCVTKAIGMRFGAGAPEEPRRFFDASTGRHEARV